MQNPKITVLMAVYNGQAYLQTAIDSILGQTFSDFEFIIIDDASTDCTPDIIELSAAQDERIVCSRNEQNIGLTRSLNKGLVFARGDYIARMDADDISLPNRLALQVDALNSGSDMVLVSGHLEIIDSEGKVVHRPQRTEDPVLIAWYLLFFNYLGGHSQIMFRRDLANKLGGYADGRPYSQDYEFWLRMARSGKIGMIPEAILQWRTHPKNISTQKRLEQDAYSLIDSGKAIAEYIGEPLNLLEVAEMRSFWLGPFPSRSRINPINRRMEKLYRNFCRENTIFNAQNSKLAIRLKPVVSQRFLCWARVLLHQADFVGVLHALWCAFRWTKMTRPRFTLRPKPVKPNPQ